MPANAQVPGTCFEIESILVDACVPGGGCANSGSPACNCEGKNEMVRFKIGPAAINTSDLSINWPNNPYLGISPANSTTAGHVAVLNATIQSCGFLKEPIGGVMPAGSTILLITSTDMCNTANSFTNLADTIYVIFQNAGNFAGHFVNYNSTPGLRTTIFKQLSTGCADTVTYDRSLLVNQSNGQGGSSSQNDGSTVDFTWPGVASYVNHSCQAPFEAIYAQAGNVGAICPAGTANLNGSATGNYTAIVWQGGLGTFSHPDSLSTSYTATIAETDSIVVRMGVIGHCNDTVFSSTTIYISIPPNPTIIASGDTSICPGDSVMLTAFGGNSYVWNTGSTASSIYASAAGTYSVTSSTNCGSGHASKTINMLTLPSVTLNAGGVTTLCAGNTATLWATGTGNYSWSTNETTDSISISLGGTYTVTASNICAVVSDTVTITGFNLPNAAISPSGSIVLCQGNSALLTASGGDTYLWNTGSITDTISVSGAGQYSVLVFNICGVDSTSVTVTAQNIPVPVISSTSTFICVGDSVVLFASGSNNYVWSTNQTSNSIIVNSAGAYSVSSSNSCGTGADTVIIMVDSIAAQFTADSVTGTAPHTVNFLNSSSGSVSNVWIFGDSTTSTDISPTHVFQNPGTYNVMLITTGLNGCLDTAYLQIIITERAPELDIPNVFTPNGDGTNDVFIVKGIGIKSFHCDIYDRWGIKMSELKTVLTSWDGRTPSGTQAKDGTYFYVIDAIDINDKAYKKSGYIQLIRE